MDLIKYDMTDIWASAGDVVAPDSLKISQGWGVEVVPRQWWNWFENRQDNNLAYLLQKGIPEWDATTEYIINKSYVQRNGIVYRATATSTNSDPIALTSWVKAFVEAAPYLELLKALDVANNTMSYIDGTGVAQNVTTTTYGRSVLNVVDAAAARTLIGAQQAHVNLSGLSSVSGDANNLPYFVGSGGMAVTAFSGFARTLLDDANATAMRATLVLDQVNNTSDADKPISTATASALAGKQPLDAALTALANVGHSANTFPYFTGTDTMLTSSVTPFARSILDDADATGVRGTISAAKSGANSDITSLAGLTTALSIAQGGTGATTAAQAVINLGITPDSLTQIEGLILRRTSAGVVTVGTGSAYVQSEGKSLVLTSPIVVNLSGLSTGTFYHFYLWNNAGATQIELAGTAPSAYSHPACNKGGDTSRRYVGSILASSATDCYDFKMSSGNRMVYNTNISSAAPFQLILGGRATTSTTVSCSTFAPITTTIVQVHLGNNIDSDASARFSNSDVGAASSSNWIWTASADPSAQFSDVELPVNSSQQFNYILDSAGTTGGVYCRGRGYFFNR